MSRVLWEGPGDWSGEWQDVLDAPLLPPVDEYCHAEVGRDYDIEPCDLPAVAWRLDSQDEGYPWPACAAHS